MICTLATKYTHPQSSQPRSLIYRLSIKGGVIDVFVDPGSELSFISEKVVNDRMILTTPLAASCIYNLCGQVACESACSSN